LVRQDGVWAENILYNVSGSDGANHVGELIVDTLRTISREQPNLAESDTAMDGDVELPLSFLRLLRPALPGKKLRSTSSPARRGATLPTLRDKNGNLHAAGTAGGFKLQDNGVVFKLIPPATAGIHGLKSSCMFSIHSPQMLPFATANGSFIDGKGPVGTTPAGGANSSGSVLNISL